MIWDKQVPNLNMLSEQNVAGDVLFMSSETHFNFNSSEQNVSLSADKLNAPDSWSDRITRKDARMTSHNDLPK